MNGNSRKSMLAGGIVSLLLVGGAGIGWGSPRSFNRTSRAYPAVSPRQVVTVPERVVNVQVMGGNGRMLYPGEEVGFSFHVDRDAYVLIYDIDTEGRTHLLYPRRPWDPGFVRGGVTNFLPARRASYRLVADGPPGEEFIVAVASERPIARRWDSSWAGLAGGTEFDDLDGVRVRVGRVNGDRFLAMDRVASRLIEVPTEPGDGCAVARDYASFFIGDPTCRRSGGEGWSPPPPPSRGHNRNHRGR
jgi:hypothetical protein